jgi:cyanophycinase
MFIRQFLVICVLTFSAIDFGPIGLFAADDSDAYRGALAIESGTGERWVKERLYQEGVRGTLVICGGGAIPDAVKQKFVESVERQKPILVLPVASDNPDVAIASVSKWLNERQVHEILTPLSVEVDGQIDQGHIGDLCDKINRCGGIWICGGQQTRIAKAYVGTEVETAIKGLIDRGGVVGGTSAGAAVMTRRMIASGTDQPQMAVGFDLLADCIIDQHFTERNRSNRLRAAIAGHPERFGLGIDEGTAVIVSGRNIDVIGNGTVSVVLAETSDKSTNSGGRMLRDEVVQKMPDQSRADLTQLRRAARWRAASIDPGQPVGETRHVPSGSLVIVGGGGMPKEIVDRFVSLAGGTEARIVVLPTAVPRDEAFRQRPPRFLTAAGVKQVTVLPQSRTDEVSSEAFRESLQQATGVWFDGGRQWNFVDAYENTQAVDLFHEVLRRGGVIGGSSAGATIQGEYLVRGHPLGNFVMMAEGYERGFGFLPGFAIDQHFSQRNRFPDLVAVVQRHPKMLGVGIDEATAIVVSQSRAEVIGQGSAHFVSNELIAAQAIDKPDEAVVTTDPRSFYRSIKSGEAIDLEALETMAEQPE